MSMPMFILDLFGPRVARAVSVKAVLRPIGLGIGLLAASAGVLRAEDSQPRTTMQGACARPEVTLVNARLSDIAGACDALRDVTTYFADQRLAFEPVITIVFNSAPPPQEDGSLRWHGAFDARALTIRLNETSGFRAWGVGADGALRPSFLHHELVHLAVHLILAQQSRHLPRHWHEFIAYAVQFELMSPALRDQILAANPEAEAFGNLLAVNEFTYGGAPEAFAISAYKTYVARGRGTFVRQVLTFEIELPQIGYPPSPLLPGQR